MQNQIEEKRNQINLELRSLLAVLDLIDGKNKKYPDYEENSMDEDSFLTQQLELVREAKNRLINVFKS